jgi:hypothetical protein
MLRVTIELISAVHSSRSTVLGIAEIINDGETSNKTGGKLGSYSVKLSKWAPMLSDVWKRGQVKDFDRVKRGPWDLLYLALRSCVGKRNKEAA